MPTGRSEPRREVRGLVGLILLALLAGCSLVSSDDDPPEPPASGPPVDVVRAITRALDRRAAAVRHHDTRKFEAGLAHQDRGFRRAQTTYLDNLDQLPVAKFRYTFDPADLVLEGDDYWVVVDVHLQLAGFDRVPVVSPDRYRFTPRAGHGYLLASVTDRDWERRNHVQAEPWETGPVEVREEPGVLGIFDAGSLPYADGVMSAVGRGLAAVAGVVPYPWSRSVVVYALADTAYLSGIEDLPGGDPEQLDGVAFPVPVRPTSAATAATRFLLHPRMLDHPGPQRDRLIRHELTHVAIGERDDDVPVWLSEGIAEYVSVRPLAPEDRLISGDALAAAEAGIRDLPADRTFNDGHSGANYGIAWWACQWIADSYGPTSLWSLLDAMHGTDESPDQVLTSLLGINSRTLARKAGKLIRLTFDPSSLPGYGPQESSSPESASPGSSR